VTVRAMDAVGQEQDLNITVNHCPDASLDDALAELITNAYDSNNKSGMDAKHVHVEGTVGELGGQPTTVRIRDAGKGLDKSSFTIGRDCSSANDALKTSGRFGLGLKDALAVLFRHNVEVSIQSTCHDCEFFLRRGGFGSETIWVRLSSPSLQQGTIFVLSSQAVADPLRDPLHALNTVRERFLALSLKKPTLLFQTDELEIFASNSIARKKKHIGLFLINGSPVLFANGRAIKMQQPTRYGYNFKQLSLVQKQAINRDHHVTSMRYFDRDINAAWVKAWSEPEMSEHIATLTKNSPSHEFARIQELTKLVLTPSNPIITGHTTLQVEDLAGAQDHEDRPPAAKKQRIDAPEGNSEVVSRRDDHITTLVHHTQEIYSVDQNILTVGEGDFSFSASLAALLVGEAERSCKIIATSLDSCETVQKTYKSAPINLKLLAVVGATVIHKIDATALQLNNFLNNGRLFDRIIFNFPSYGHECAAGYSGNRDLVSRFLASAAKLLAPDGQIHITLKKEQAQSWKLGTSACSSGLRINTTEAFCQDSFPGYIPKRGNRDDSFPVAGSIMHSLTKGAAGVDPAQQHTKYGGGGWCL